MTSQKYASQCTAGDDRENVGVEVDGQGEGVQGKPAKAEDGHHNH